jgi:hypothetical protein
MAIDIASTGPGLYWHVRSWLAIGVPMLLAKAEIIDYRIFELSALLMQLTPH